MLLMMGTEPVNMFELVFPIGHIQNGIFHRIGVGFFVTSWGGFLTAGHVLRDEEGITQDLVGITINEGGWRERKVLSQFAVTHPEADVGYGVLEPVGYRVDQPLGNPILPLGLARTKAGASVASLVYPPNTFSLKDPRTLTVLRNVAWSPGRIIDTIYTGRHLSKRWLARGLFVPSGASGGPVLSRSGFVVGVNSTSYQDAEGVVEDAFIAPVEKALELPVSGTATLRDFALQGLILFQGVTPSEFQSNHRWEIHNANSELVRDFWARRRTPR